MREEGYDVALVSLMFIVPYHVQLDYCIAEIPDELKVISVQGVQDM